MAGFSTEFSNDQGLPVCPNCGGAETRRSKRRGLFDRFASLFGYLPYRCESCDLRFLKRNIPAGRALRSDS
jgi:hypothetical protein